MHDQLAKDLPNPRNIHVYVAGPYTGGDVTLNLRTAVLVGQEIYENLGVIPFVPHLYNLWHTVQPGPYEQWMELCFAWIARCDALLRIPGESPGADREMEVARELDKPVFTSRDDLAAWLTMRDTTQYARKA